MTSTAKINSLTVHNKVEAEVARMYEAAYGQSPTMAQVQAMELIVNTDPSLIVRLAGNIVVNALSSGHFTDTSKGLDVYANDMIQNATGRSATSADLAHWDQIQTVLNTSYFHDWQFQSIELVGIANSSSAIYYSHTWLHIQ